jgi:hypothetical protein
MAERGREEQGGGRGKGEGGARGKEGKGGDGGANIVYEFQQHHRVCSQL